VSNLITGVDAEQQIGSEISDSDIGVALQAWKVRHSISCALRVKTWGINSASAQDSRTTGRSQIATPEEEWD